MSSSPYTRSSTDSAPLSPTVLARATEVATDEFAAEDVSKHEAASARSTLRSSWLGRIGF
ncbi:hypothetical protein [Rhodococcus xishaensis]|uniref:hypothetical protein n=1 Tax=Rhodococcus xishaensis TaxID=2487364 RepID=UPI000FDE245A|nr:hypothetical protein [Rhodococcus xishaensis]